MTVISATVTWRKSCASRKCSKEKSMEKSNIEKIYALTPLQQGMLFQHLYSPESSVYNMQVDFTLEGDLDIDALQQSWSFLVERHAVLRTVFAWERMEKPYQVVHRHADFKMMQHD
ncbi:MAG TPA: hypothetical protein ENJ64_06050, partial [Thiotrichales bacterium]|nr:hypothetical protein [Thiotrichales bacterium]